MALSTSKQRLVRAAGAMLVVAAAIPFAGVTSSSAVETVDRAPDASQQFTSDNNKPSSWVGVNDSTQCWKHKGEGRIDGGSHGKESADDASVWKMGTPPSDKTFTLLVLKAGQLDHVWYDPTPGALYGTPVDGNSSKDISHVIVCKAPKTTTPPTTTPPATTTPPTTTPPTTEPPTSEPPTTEPLKKVSPVLECVETVVPGQEYVARFGYNNPNAVEVNIPLGSTNKFTPSPEDQGQPTDFLPGRHGATDSLGVFTVVFDGSNLVWTLNGKTSTASANSKSCPVVETTPPPTTEPPTTEPPTTEPPTTEPPTTEPPTTEPPTTEPPTTEPPTTEPPTTEPPLGVEFVTPECDGDVPYLTYNLTGANEGATVTITWINPDGEDVVQTGLPLNGRTLWPGAVIDDEGNPLDWPGWTLVDGVWEEGDEFDWVRPEVQVVIEVEGGADTLSVGTARFQRLAEVGEPTTVAYPPATPVCAADPPGVDETADPGDPSVEPTVLGEKFSGLPKTGGSSLALQLALSLGLLVAGAALIALPNRLTPATERRH